MRPRSPGRPCFTWPDRPGWPLPQAGRLPCRPRAWPVRRGRTGGRRAVYGGRHLRVAGRLARRARVVFRDGVVCRVSGRPVGLGRAPAAARVVALEGHRRVAPPGPVRRAPAVYRVLVGLVLAGPVLVLVRGVGPVDVASDGAAAEESRVRQAGTARPVARQDVPDTRPLPGRAAPLPVRRSVGQWSGRGSERRNGWPGGPRAPACRMQFVGQQPPARMADHLRRSRRGVPLARQSQAPSR
jgi:hypothetical protein